MLHTSEFTVFGAIAALFVVAIAVAVVMAGEAQTVIETVLSILPA